MRFPSCQHVANAAETENVDRESTELIPQLTVKFGHSTRPLTHFPVKLRFCCFRFQKVFLFLLCFCLPPFVLIYKKAVLLSAASKNSCKKEERKRNERDRQTDRHRDRQRQRQLARTMILTSRQQQVISSVLIILFTQRGGRRDRQTEENRTLIIQ